MKGALNNLKNILNASKNLKKNQPEFSDTGMLSWRATVVRKKMIEFSQRSRDEEIRNTNHIAEPLYPLTESQKQICEDFMQNVAPNMPTPPESNRNKTFRAPSNERNAPYHRASPHYGSPRQHRSDRSGSAEKQRRDSWSDQSQGTRRDDEDTYFTEASPPSGNWEPDNSMDDEKPREKQVDSVKSENNKRSSLDPERVESKEQPPVKKFKSETGESVPAPVRAPPPVEAPVFNKIVAPTQPEEKRNPNQRTWNRKNTRGKKR